MGSWRGTGGAGRRWVGRAGVGRAEGESGAWVGSWGRGRKVVLGLGAGPLRGELGAGPGLWSKTLGVGPESFACPGSGSLKSGADPRVGAGPKKMPGSWGLGQSAGRECWGWSQKVLWEPGARPECGGEASR